MDDDSDNDSVPSLVEDDDEDLKHWLNKPSDSSAFNTLLNTTGLVRRYLDPGNVASLYDHYKAVQDMLKCRAVSILGLA